MLEYILQFLAIYAICLFKFIGGPLLGNAADYSIFEIVLVTVSGMMTSVVVFTFLGEWIKTNWTIKIRKNKRKFTPKTRKIIQVWQKFGAAGVAAITPLVLTPIGGTILLTSFGVKRRKIFTYMLLSSICWAFVLGMSINQIMKIPFLKQLLG
ncbi:hypothetical protein DN752_09350 [Echinicola strongylocentroti]|uniref:Small multi-drug export protein n=1 Tax=Echinicola strongylocentroti TaxID=1795355 RepID=A0A2Z4IGT1_9BACT|nr:hypothetical protein [Echinicola strongylocentroti]AWW30312.1 hypothetical protein DN752_09350 [Echinicola strongylocentroti]